jgi:hypothetical protein
MPYQAVGCKLNKFAETIGSGTVGALLCFKINEIALVTEPIKQAAGDTIAFGEQVEGIDDLTVNQSEVGGMRDKVGV